MDWLQQKSTSSFTPRDRVNSEDLWRTPHYPMHAVKSGTSLFLDFLDDLDFGDEVGLVGYGQWAEQIPGYNDGVIDIDISSDPITPDYDLIDDHAAPPSGGRVRRPDGDGRRHPEGQANCCVGDGSETTATRATAPGRRCW